MLVATAEVQCALNKSYNIVPLRGLFWSTHRDFRFQAFLSERCPAAVTDDESPFIAPHTRKPIGVESGRRMGLFLNNIHLISKYAVRLKNIQNMYTFL
ncbi:hypothetical protein Zmor_002341 [Zophobas morio]|uniref:Uncharacterized protein n=1 Tax=Zophobas morio TaxID=2755281 RepID=A0AA38J4S0_9CUCU|nr:hypothetical protein Zmor_002341 [Zophobas morio]